MIYEDAMLRLCRLSDPAKTRHQENLSVLALSTVVSDPILTISLETKTDQVRKCCEFARKSRDKRLAHSDLTIHRKGRALALPPVAQNDIESALKSIQDLLTLVEDHHGLPHSLLAADPWGPKSLVHYLEKADRAFDQEREQWRMQESKDLG
jgi:hypothetical protein